MKNEQGFVVTDWFPMSTPPTKPGVYQFGYVVYTGEFKEHLYSYGYWNGTCVMGIESGPYPKLLDGEDYKSYTLNKETNFWRGCLNENGA